MRVNIVISDFFNYVLSCRPVELLNNQNETFPSILLVRLLLLFYTKREQPDFGALCNRHFGRCRGFR